MKQQQSNTHTQKFKTYQKWRKTSYTVNFMLLQKNYNSAYFAITLVFRKKQKKKGPQNFVLYSKPSVQMLA